MITGSVPWSVAAVDDSRYQAYVRKKSPTNTVSQNHFPESDKPAIEFETCPSGVFQLLQRLPVDSRDMIALMLMPEPQDRPSLQTLLS